MRAFRVYGAHDARYEELPDPTPGLDEALIRVRAAAICGTDLEIYDGSLIYFHNGMADFPIIPGHEWSGEVLAVGEAVTHVQPGDKVVGECTVGCGACDYCQRGLPNVCPNRRETGILHLDGAYAELMAYPAQHLYRFQDLSFEQAALCETTAVSMYAVRRAGVTPSDRVAVLGAGPIGLQAIQAAKAYGARQVVVIGGRPSRQELALQLGADAAIDRRSEDVEQQVLDLTDGQRFDVVIEATGNPQVTRSLMQLVRPAGRISLVGLFGGQPGEFDLDSLVVNGITVQGSLGSPNVWEETLHLLESGRIQASPLITERHPLAEAEQVLQRVASKPPELIKAVLLP